MFVWYMQQREGIYKDFLASVFEYFIEVVSFFVLLKIVGSHENFDQIHEKQYGLMESFLGPGG